MFAYHGLCILAIFSLPMLSLCDESEYKEDVDSIIKKELGDEPFDHETYFKNFEHDIKNIHMQNIKLNQTILNNTEPQLSGDDIIQNIVKHKLRILLNRDNDRVNDIKNNVDGFQKLTNTLKQLKTKSSIIDGRRSYDQLISGMLHDAQEVVEDIIGKKTSLRENFDPDQRPYRYNYNELTSNYPRKMVERLKNKTISVMYTHIYRVHYYIALSQKMRWKYIDHPRYRLGFSFCLLKQLLKEQKTIIHGIEFNYKKLIYPGNMNSWALHTYGKVQRLERDIRDLMHHIKALEYERKMHEIPLYYDYFASSTGRYSG